MADFFEYTTKDGDEIDKIVFSYYSSVFGYIEKVIEDNPHLTKLDKMYDLPAGIVIKLRPAETVVRRLDVIELW